MAKKSSVRAKRRGLGRPKAESGPRTGDAVLIRKMLRSDCDGRRHLMIQDLIYNMSGELCRLAYGSGFELGAEAYGNSDRTMDALGRLLAHAGLGRTTFQLSKNQGIITSYGAMADADLGIKMHGFEAGIIAGYLSAHARRRIAVRETNCACSGSRFCQFVASSAPQPERRSRSVSMEELVRLADRSMRFYGAPATSKPYYLLFNRPLTQEPVLAHASRLAYLIGKKLAESEPPSGFERGVIRMARHLGIERARVVSERGRGRSIELTYDHYGSTRGFVDLTTAMLAGFSRGVFNKNIYIQRRLNSKMNYLVKMSLLTASARRERVQQ
jgi:hypothetical protein